MICYRLTVDDSHAHLFRVSVTVPRPAARQRLSLPVWIPGSYLIREFARHLSGMAATRHGRPLALTQIDKASWQAECPADESEGDDDDAAAALVVSYRVYAFDTSVRAAFLDARRGFFNGTGVFLRVEGREAEPHRLALHDLPAGWQVATAMPPRRANGRRDATGSGGRGGAAHFEAAHFEAAGYDELADHPVELGGAFWRGAFEAHGVPHEFVVAGALPDFDGARLLADAKRICEAAITFWHRDEGPGGSVVVGAPPFARYLFLLNAVDDGYGGLEHRASTALIAARRDLPRLAPPGAPASAADPELPDGYATLLGLISHEYFHAWNVKRLKPREFERYDYTRENYTGLLWFFEGFTSYYDDLLLLRAGLIDEPRYLKLLGKTLGNVLAAPGRAVQSVAQASFDAWVKYYRADENTPNATVSYYAKGAAVALALDLTLRGSSASNSGSGAGDAGGAVACSHHRPTLDRVMRLLWQRSGADGNGACGGGLVTEADVLSALRDVAGRPFADELAAWVHGTGELPLRQLLAGVGVHWQVQPPSAAQRLGLRVAESALTGVKVTHVLRGGAAEAAGVAAGDELLAVDEWRLRRLDEALRLLQPAGAAALLVSRDQRLLRLPLVLPPLPVDGSAASAAGGAVTLVAEPRPAAEAAARRKAWFAG